MTRELWDDVGPTTRKPRRKGFRPAIDWRLRKLTKCSRCNGSGKQRCAHGGIHTTYRVWYPRPVTVVDPCHICNGTGKQPLARPAVTVRKL